MNEHSAQGKKFSPRLNPRLGERSRSSAQSCQLKREGADLPRQMFILNYVFFQLHSLKKCTKNMGKFSLILGYVHASPPLAVASNRHGVDREGERETGRFNIKFRG